MDWLDWLLPAGRVVVVFFGLLILVMVLIWIERKVIADMQTRVGPMRAGPRGILITLADGIKLFFKEGITPTLVDRPVYAIAPIERPDDLVRGRDGPRARRGVDVLGIAQDVRDRREPGHRLEHRAAVPG